jgi:hypothetical protein
MIAFELATLGLLAPNNLIPMILFVAMVLFTQFGTQYVTSYMVDSTYLRWMLFGSLTLTKIPMSKLSDARSVSYWDGFGTMYLNLTPRVARTYVVLKRTRGYPRYVRICPNDPEEFIRSFWACKSGKPPGPEAAAGPQPEIPIRK